MRANSLQLTASCFKGSSLDFTLQLSKNYLVLYSSKHGLMSMRGFTPSNSASFPFQALFWSFGISVPGISLLCLISAQPGKRQHIEMSPVPNIRQKLDYNDGKRFPTFLPQRPHARPYCVTRSSVHLLLWEQGIIPRQFTVNLPCCNRCCPYCPGAHMDWLSRLWETQSSFGPIHLYAAPAYK